ncbi:GGDEF domain-containing protein [Leucothrix mucor]|uniref:GGDEF domain-containing protein n=1 Tax=Leucothrix mucor TaxID=45248 RepID=UPI0003B5839C|nr:GGDEF domain-containing protein [Leucothrix mucor]
MARYDKRYSVKRISIIAFLFVAMLIIACSFLISCNLRLQKNMLEASSVSYELRILIDRTTSQANLLFNPENISQLSDRILFNVRDDLVKTTGKISENNEQLRKLLLSGQGLWVMVTPSLDRQQVSVEMDKVDKTWARFQARVDDISNYNLITLRAGNKYWQPVDALIATNGPLFNSITKLNQLIYEASLLQNTRLRMLYAAVLALVLAGIWAVWFLTLRPLARRLKASYLEIMDKNQHLDYQANHDSLTGLSNRTCFNTKVHHIENRVSAVDACCLVLVDLDDFKMINDSLGHDAGDAMLKKVARDLRRLQLHGEQAYRLGGDEFALLIDEPTTREDLTARLDRLLSYVREPLTFQGMQIHCYCSIGVAWGGEHGARTLTALFKAADNALYRVKQSGRNNYCFYTDISDDDILGVNTADENQLSASRYIQ